MRRATNYRCAAGLAVLLLAPAAGKGDDAIAFKAGDSLWKSYQTEADRLYRDAHPDPTAAMVVELDESHKGKLDAVEKLVQPIFSNFAAKRSLFPGFTPGRVPSPLAMTI